MENLTINYEKKYAFLDARDTNSWVLTYLKGVKYVLLDYIDGKFEDDPSVAYALLEEILDKSINSTIEVSKYLDIEAENRKEAKAARGLSNATN